MRLCIDYSETKSGCQVVTTFTAHIAYAFGAHTDGVHLVDAWATRNTLASAKNAAVTECRNAGGVISGEYACAVLDRSSSESLPSSHSNSPATDGREESGKQLLPLLIPTPPRAPTAMPSSLSSAGYFTFNVVVAGNFSEDTLVFRRSSDATITASDTAVATRTEYGPDDIDVLAITGRDGATTEITTEVYAASTGWYGVCKGSICSDGVRVTVGGSAGIIIPSGYQLAITSVSLAAGAQQSGAGTMNLRLSVTVRNSGSTPSPANTSFILYRSDDGALGSGDTAVGTYQVGVVTAGSDKVITQDITTPTLSTDANNPTHFIVAGGFEDETDADDDAVSNNYLGVAVYSTDGIVISNGDAITGNEIVTGIEYDWSATAAAVSKASVATGEKITLTFEVTNNTAFRTPRASLSFYRSSDAAITAVDTGLGAASIRPLAAGATSKVSTDVSAPSSTGTYYYGACIVAADDGDSTNDCTTGVAVTVTGATKYGALAYGEKEYGWFAGSSVNQPTQAAAHSEAIRLCRVDRETIDGEITSACAVLTTFSAHIAYAGGINASDVGIIAWATRNTLSTAETAAVAECRRAGGLTSGEGACALLGTFDDEFTSSYSNSPATAGTEETGNVLLGPFDTDEITPPRAPTATPSSLSSAGYFEFNVVVAGDFSDDTLVFRQSSDATITSSDATVTARSRNVVSTGIDDDATTEITAEVYAASTGYYGVCAGSTCSDGVRVTVSSGGGGSGTCTVGQVLAAGDSCTLSGGTVVSVNAGGTQVCYGSSICGGTGFNVGSVSVSKVTGGYRIDAL